MFSRTLIAFASLVIVFRADAAETFTRPAMLDAIAQHCIVPGLEELSTGAAKLLTCAQSLEKEPTPALLHESQQAWIDLQLTYKRNQMLAHGPVRDYSYWEAMFFSQALGVAVENVIRSSRPIDRDFIEILGSSAKGFYVIEYLLFDAPNGTGAVVGKKGGTPRHSSKLLLEGPTAERRRHYVAELIRDLDQRLRAAASDAREYGFSSKFAARGQDAADLVVNQVIHGIETGVIEPLTACTSQFDAGRLRYDMIPGINSGTSVSAMKAALDGVYRYYTGREGLGVDDYIHHINPDLASRLDKQFKATVAALEQITTPLDQAILNDRSTIEHAIEEAKELERLCKVDVVSALGITIMFSSGDGD